MDILFKGTVVHRTYHSLNGGSQEIAFTDPLLIGIFYVKHNFLFKSVKIAQALRNPGNQIQRLKNLVGRLIWIKRK